MGVEFGFVGQLVQYLPLQSAFGQRGPQRAGLGRHASAPFGGGQIAVGAGRVDQEPRQRHRLLHIGGKTFWPVFADVAVGVVLRRQEQELDAAGVGGPGQGCVQRLACRTPAGGVAVEAEHHRVGEAKQLLHMVGCAGGAERRNSVRKTQLGQRHHVHIAFGDQAIAGLADSGARFKQAVEFAAFAEHRGFGRVQVFGLAFVQHPAAKANAFALHVADREHHPVAEAVVAFGVALGVFLVFVLDHQARLGEQGVAVVREHIGQVAPALGRIAQAKGFGDLAGQAAAFQIVHRARAVFERFGVRASGFFQHVGEGGLLLPHLRGAGAVFG